MTSYKVSNLTTNTPKNDRTKLETNLKGVLGVDTVQLHPERSEFSLTYQEAKQPKVELLEAACTKAGFTLAPAPASSTKPAAIK